MRRRIACLRDSGNLAWSIAAAFISLIRGGLYLAHRHRAVLERR